MADLFMVAVVVILLKACRQCTYRAVMFEYCDVIRRLGPLSEELDDVYNILNNTATSQRLCSLENHLGP